MGIKIAGTGFLLGLLLICLSIRSCSSGRHLIAAGTKATARVIDYKVDQDDDGYHYSKMLEFTTAQGEKIKFHAHGRSRHPTGNIGDQVTVIYDPLHPQQAAVYSFMEIYTGAIISSVAGLPLFILAGAYLLSRRKRIISRFAGRQNVQ